MPSLAGTFVQGCTSAIETSHSGSRSLEKDVVDNVTPSPVKMISTAIFLNALIGVIVVVAGQHVC